MKVLVLGRAIGHQPGRCTGERLAEGFRQAGHESVFFGAVHGDWESLRNPNKMIGMDEVRAMEGPWDLVIQTEMNDGMPDYAPLFQSPDLRDIPTIYWDFDASYDWPSAQRRAGSHRYDGYLVGNKDYVEKFRERFGKPCLHITYACSPQWETDLDSGIKAYLIGFVGSMTPERQELVDGLKTMDVPVTVQDGVYGDDLIRLTNEMRIMFHRNQDACKGLVPGRPWEAGACGTVLMMDRAAYEDFAEFLPERYREDVLVYDDEENDIRRLVSYWKTHTAELGMMGKNLGQYLRENHSYKQRAETIITFCEEQNLLKGQDNG